MKNKLYWLDLGEGCLGIIAPNTKEARKYATRYEFYADTFDGYLDMTHALSRAKSKVDVSKFPVGEVELELSDLEQKFWAEMEKFEEECPVYLSQGYCVDGGIRVRVIIEKVQP